MTSRALTALGLLLISAVAHPSATTHAFPLPQPSNVERMHAPHQPETTARNFHMAPRMPLSLAALAADGDHAYFRPSGDHVSGVPKNNASYHRSPCPAMNTLANHGYLPRDGKNLTPELIKAAVMEVFHLDEGVAQMLVNTLPETLTLADLGEHNFIEHDASMVHDDHYFGHDPSAINATLVQGLLERANDKQRLTKREVAHWRHDREQECAATNPEYDFGFSRQGSAYAEAAAFLIAMGDYDSESISVAHARSFLLEERIPDDFERSKVPITTTVALYVAAKIKIMASYPWAVVAGY